MKRHQDASHLAWIDLEMTGLDPSTDVILQAALIVTDRELVPLEEFVCDVWQPARALETMVPFVRDMHHKNGLLERVAASDVDVRAAEIELMTRVCGWCGYPATLCGNSVGLDKAFIECYMPGLAGYLHYRIVDVSSLKVLARLWGGETAVFTKAEAGAHDALVDIRNSIAELKHYRETLLR